MNLSTYSTAKHAGFLRDWERLFERYDLENMPHSKYPGLLALFEPESYHQFDEYGFTYPNTSVFSENLVFNPTVRLRDGIIIRFRDREIQPGVKRDELILDDKNYYTKTDPGFVDWRNENFILREDARVFQMIPGFPAIPFDKIGIVDGVGPFGGK